MQHKPIYGVIAHTGTLFTLHYHYEDHGDSKTTGINKQGYDLNVFRDCPDDLPIIRFDLSEFENVLDNIAGDFTFVQEFMGLRLVCGQVNAFH